MELDNWKLMDVDQRIKFIKKVKNDVIGSVKQKTKYWNWGLLETLISSMDDIEMSSDLLIGALSIFVCYSNGFEDAFDWFRFYESFPDRVVDNISKAIELNEDNRIIDWGMQIIRNLIVNDIITYEKAIKLNIIKLSQGLLDNNKRVNLVAQIISKLAKNSSEIKSFIIEEKTIIDKIIDSIELKGSSTFRVSLLDWLVNLASNNETATNYIRDNINIQKLISLIKFQNNEINAKVAYLATILNSDKKISGDFENLVKQIIFQITRMMQSTNTIEILEGTTMLYNLVKWSELETEMPSGRKSLWIHTCEIGATEILSKVLSKFIDEYNDLIRGSQKSTEETKDAKMDLNEKNEANKDDVKLSDRELDIDDANGNLLRCKTIILNILKITQNLMNAHYSCLKKIIAVNIPANLFKLISNTVGDQLRVWSWECIRILARAKKVMKIQIIEEDQDLEALFKGLINDKNIEIQKLGLAIIWNFSIDFPGMILTFNDFMPKLKDFILQDKNLDIKFYSIKTIKNLLFAGHPNDVRKNAEKMIFEWISIKEIFSLLDDDDPRVREQVELIFKSLQHWTNKDNGSSQETKQKSILDSIEDQSMKERIKSIAQTDERK